MDQEGWPSSQASPELACSHFTKLQKHLLHSVDLQRSGSHDIYRAVQAFLYPCFAALATASSKQKQFPQSHRSLQSYRTSRTVLSSMRVCMLRLVHLGRSLCASRFASILVSHRKFPLDKRATQFETCVADPVTQGLHAFCHLQVTGIKKTHDAVMDSSCPERKTSATMTRPCYDRNCEIA